MTPHIFVLRSSQNLYINVTKIAHIMLHNNKIFLSNNQEGFTFVTVKASAEFRDEHVTFHNGAPFITPYTKANICFGYVIPQESPVYRKSEKYGLLRNQNWFGAVHPNVQIDAKHDYMVSQVLQKMDCTSLSICKKFCDLDRNLNQNAFILLTQKFPIVGYFITGQRHTFATLKS